MMSATMGDLAKACGVSRAVVSLVLNGRAGELRIAKTTREKILAEAKRLGYCRNELARAVVTGKSRVIAAVFPGETILAEYTLKILDGIVTEASRHDYSVKIFKGSCEERSGIMDRIRGQCIAGILLHGSRIAPLRPWLKDAAEAGIPAGTVNLENRTGFGFGVYADDSPGVCGAVGFLARLGHRRIAYLEPAGRVRDYIRRRREGYLKGISEIPDAKAEIFRIPEEKIDTELPRLLKSENSPRAFCCVSDYYAAGLYRAAWKTALRIPEDLSVIGFSGMNLADNLPVRLTTVVQPLREIGETAVKTAIRLIESNAETGNGENTALPPRLKIQESCKKKETGK